MLSLRKTILAVYLVFIGYISLLPADDIPDVGGWDKLNHGLAYALMSLLAAWSIRSPRLFFSLLPALVFYGGSLEIVQSMVGRQGSWLDALANLTGVLVGVLIARTLVCSTPWNRYFALANYPKI